MLTSDAFVVTEPVTYTLRFYPDWIRIKKLKTEEEIQREHPNWVTIHTPGVYSFFGSCLSDVRCVRLDGKQEKPITFKSVGE